MMTTTATTIMIVIDGNLYRVLMLARTVGWGKRIVSKYLQPFNFSLTQTHLAPTRCLSLNVMWPANILFALPIDQIAHFVSKNCYCRWTRKTKLIDMLILCKQHRMLDYFHFILLCFYFRLWWWIFELISMDFNEEMEADMGINKNNAFHHDDMIRMLPNKNTTTTTTAAISEHDNT